MLAIRTEDNKVFKQISTPAFEDRVIADGGTVSSVDNTDKILDAVAAIGVQPSVVMVPSGIKASKLYSQIPYGGGADFTVTRSGTTGMRLNNGYWQPVAADTPRVDLTWDEATQMFIEWLEVEEARTNLISRYKSFAHSDWIKSGASIQGDPSTAGAEKVTNGGFDTDTGWTKQTGWTISSGVAKYDGVPAVSILEQPISITAGKVYKLVFSIPATSARFTISNESANSIFGLSYTTFAPGNYTFYYTAINSATALRIYATNTGGGVAFDIDNISVKEVTGYASPFVDASGNNLMSGYKLVESAANVAHLTYTAASITTTSGSVYNHSIFAKAQERNWCYFEDVTLGIGAYFNLSDGSTGTKGSGVTAKTTYYLNGWYRLEFSFTATTSTRASIRSSTGNNIASYLGDGTSGILIAHAQLEAGATASSPIGGAEGSSQTRNADAIVKTGASALIGQTEGYAVVELNVSKLYNLGRYLLALYNNLGSATNSIRLLFTSVATNRLDLSITNSSGVVSNLFSKTITSLGNYKIGIAWKDNDCVLVVNSEIITATTSGALGVSNLSNVIIGANRLTTELFNDRIKLIDMGKTRLSNAQLQALTTL